MEDHYGSSGDEEDLCKNGTKIAEWRTKGAACASVSRYFGATQNWNQLAEKSCYLWWVMGLRVRSTHQTEEPSMEERIVTKTQKGEGVQVQNQGDADRFFGVHGIVQAEFLPQGQTINHNVYKNILRRLMRLVKEKRRELWEKRSWLLHHDNAPADNVLGIREFLVKNNIAILEQPFYSPDLVPCFCFPNSRKLSNEYVFKIQKPLKQLRDKRTSSDPGGILPGVRGSVAEEIGKVHSSPSRLLWRRHVVKFTCQIK